MFNVLNNVFFNKTQKLIDKLRKTSKDKSAFEKCENFCKNDYSVKS